MTNLVTRRIATCVVLPWLRSQRYWAQAGVDVFTSGEVPYIVTNDGEQSRKALELYLASLRAAELRGDRAGRGVKGIGVAPGPRRLRQHQSSERSPCPTGARFNLTKG